MRTIGVPEVVEVLAGSGELALLDAREQGVFLHRHLFHAACLPLSRLELRLSDLVPRRSAPIVWCDAGDGDDLAMRAAVRSEELGWTDVAVLAGGVDAWERAGHEVYAGVNVPSKAFGEHVEHTYGTPRLSADELRSLLDAGSDLVVLDSRPIEEYRRMSIPTGIDCPGAELVHRVKAVVSDPDTLVVVNCAGRTRSIIGCQSLVNAGLENRVVALENGTMGWELAGYDVDSGQDTHAAEPAAEARAWARSAAASVGRRFGVRHTDHDTLTRWQAESDRTTVLLDVRTPDEFRGGHLDGSVSAPGGQLVQATDEYVAVRNARLVLVDDDGVRATMTASWLRQMGWDDAVVLEDALVGRPLRSGPVPRAASPSVPATTVAELADRLQGDVPPVVLDVDSSVKYRRRGHVPGAWWGVRSRLADARRVIGDVAELVLVSTDGQLAKLAVDDARRHWPDATITALTGGNRAWRHAGHEMVTGFDRATTTPDDVWYKPYDHEGDVVAQHMRDYLEWEVALVEQLRRDPTVSFPTFD